MSNQKPAPAASPRRRRSNLPSPDPVEAAQIIARMRPLVLPLQRAIPGNAEVVLHDFSRLPNSIIEIEGTVTGRTVGSPATESLLRIAESGHIESTETYDVRLPGGRELRSTNVAFHDSKGAPVCALSVIIDVTMWRAVHALAASMLPAEARRPLPEEADEHFASDIDGLAAQLLAEALAAVQVPVALMHKRHKLVVTDDLKKRGFFLLKGSVESAAAALGVTRFTIYNYLNELEAKATGDQNPEDAS